MQGVYYRILPGSVTLNAGSGVKRQPGTGKTTVKRRNRGWMQSGSRPGDQGIKHLVDRNRPFSGMELKNPAEAGFLRICG